MAFKKMIGRNMLSVVILISFLAVTDAMAFQFEDFVWGTSAEDVMVMLERGKKHIVADDNRTELAYKDKILDQMCTVTLFFTPRSGILYMVKLRWETPSIGDKLREALTGMHGIPLQNDKAVAQYVWFGGSEEEMLALDYSGEVTELIYSAADVYANNDATMEKRIERGDRF